MTGIKVKRLTLNLSQTDLEKKSGIPHWKLSLAERGLLNLTEQEWTKIAQALNAQPSSLKREVEI